MLSPHVHIPFQRIKEHLDIIRRNRLNLEIYFNAETLDSLQDGDLKSLQSMLDHNPSLSFHGPFMDLCPGAVDDKVRSATLSRFNHMLDIAEVLAPRTIVFHSGYEKWKYALHIDLWLEKSLLTWEPLAKRASGIGTRIAIENIFEDTPENLKILMEKMGSDYFGICFDTGHYNLFNNVSLEHWMTSLAPYIIELHLHDNDKSSDQHLPVGDGNFDFRRFFSLLSGKNCVFTIEAHNPENVMRSISALKGLLQETSHPVAD